MNTQIRNIQSTAIVYHEDMVDHSCLWDSKFTECPERFTVILKRCETLGLLDRCVRIPCRSAEVEEIAWIHSPELLELLKSCESKSVEELEEFSSRYDFIYFCNATYRLAILAAGSTINLVESICSDQVKNGMAIIRPPGHHAMKSAFCGYCYLNNVALAATFALKKLHLSRILIVDWDVHHGQATQQMFYDDPRVLYFSIHRFEDGKHWPNLKESNADYVGEGAGRGFNINVPLNRIGLGNADYLTIFHQILLPVAVEFEPELILISAGYDAALGCPEGEMEVTPACYAHFVHSLRQLANGKLAVVLEGGYSLKSLAEGAALSLKALLGDPCPMIEPIGKADDRTRESILNVINFHRPYWNCFQTYNTHDSSIMNDFHANLKFEYEPVVIDRYPTRDICPTQDEESARHYDSLLNKLIKDTELYIPKLRSSIYSHLNLEVFSQMSNKYVENVTTFPALDQMASTILEKMFAKVTNSVVVDENSLRHFYGHEYHLDKFVNNFLGNLKSKKVMWINFDLVRNHSLAHVGNFLQFSFDHNTSIRGEENLNIIHFPLKEKSMNNSNLLTAWFKILFPIAYQFCPEFVIIYIDYCSIGSNSDVAVELLPHFLHWSTAFGNGRVVIIVNYNEQCAKQREAFIQCYWALSGANMSPIPTRNVTETDSKFFTDHIKNSYNQLQKCWANLDYFVNYVK